jgi:hypothetical protein
VGELTHISTVVLDDINFVTLVNGLNCGKGHADLRPQPAQNDLFRPVFSMAATKFFSSQEFIDDRSIGV